MNNIVRRQFSTKQSLALKVLSTHQKKQLEYFLDLTKFKLSALNAVGSYTMFYYHAPLLGVGSIESFVFIFATQTIAMSTQCFG
jgi:hypothetical protein